MSSTFDEDVPAHSRLNVPAHPQAEFLQADGSLETSEPTGQRNPPSPEAIARDQDNEAADVRVVRMPRGPATCAEAGAADASVAALSLLHGASSMPLAIDGIDEDMELILVHATPPKPPTQEDMQLPTRKLYVRTSGRLLATLEPLRHLAGKHSAQFTLLDEGVPLEAMGAALEWLAVGDAAEREELLESLPDWRALLGVLAAASWLGQPCHALHQACEARLRPEVCLEHVLALAIAADKCDTLLV